MIILVLLNLLVVSAEDFSKKSQGIETISNEYLSSGIFSRV